jgi:hypothetical protein
MDRFLEQDGADFQTRTVGVDLKFTAGTSGAVPASLTFSAGVKSVVKSGNTYVVTFQDGYVGLLGVVGNVLQATYSASGAVIIQPVAVTDTTSPAVVTLQPYTAAGGAVALATGDILTCYFRFKG